MLQLVASVTENSVANIFNTEFEFINIPTKPNHNLNENITWYCFNCYLNSIKFSIPLFKSLLVQTKVLLKQ